MHLDTRVRRIFLYSAIATILFFALVFFTSFYFIAKAQRDLAVRSLNEALLQEVENKTGTLLETLAENLYDPLYYFDFQEIGRLLEQTAKDADTLFIYLVDANWMLIHDGREPAFGMPVTEAGVVVPPPGQTIVRFDDHIQFFMPVQNDVEIEGYVIADVSLGALESYQQQISLQFERGRAQSLYIISTLVLAMGSMIILGALGLRRMMDRHLLQPLLKLKLNAERVGAGQLDEVIEVEGDHEIQLLGKALEDMRLRLKRSISKERQMAYFDSVTELPNRFSFQTKLETLVTQRRPLTVLFFDLDEFKQVNDTLGHTVGDGLLAAFGNRMLNRLKREHSIDEPLYRLGGDEFVLIVERDLKGEKLEALGRTCINLVAQPFEINGHTCRVGVSIGAARYPEHGETSEIILQHADIAMYQAKRSGKNRMVVFEASLEL